MGVSKWQAWGGEGEGAYQAMLCSSPLVRPKLGLQVRGRMEVATWVTRTAALDSIHANCDSALVRGDHVIRRVSEAALRLWPLARTTLKLAANLQAESPPATAWHPSGIKQDCATGQIEGEGVRKGGWVPKLCRVPLPYIIHGIKVKIGDN